MTPEEKENQITRLQEVLKENGFEMNLFGCGCCDSPVLKVWYKGELIADQEYPYSFFEMRRE